jgi:hypothetical protein
VLTALLKEQRDWWKRHLRTHALSYTKCELFRTIFELAFDRLTLLDAYSFAHCGHCGMYVHDDVLSGQRETRCTTRFRILARQLDGVGYHIHTDAPMRRI